MTRDYDRTSVDYDTWYSPWMKRLARHRTRDELLRMRDGGATEARKASQAHHKAVSATASMAGQSQRRAHTRNAVAAAGDTLIAIDGALEIHDLFPEHAKTEDA